MPHLVPNLALFLAGPWRIARRVHDQRLGATGRLTGVATFTPASGGLRYEEQGTLILGTYRGETSRSYGFTITGPASAEVRFDDGRPFHHLDLSCGLADVAHDCAPDHYRGRYRTNGQDGWRLTWRIHRPRKRMSIATCYSRRAADTGAGGTILRAFSER